MLRFQLGTTDSPLYGDFTDVRIVVVPDPLVETADSPLYGDFTDVRGY